MWSSQLVNEIHRMNNALKFSVLAESKEECDYAFTKSKYIDCLPGMVLVTVNILLTLKSSPDICCNINVYRTYYLLADMINSALTKMNTSKKILIDMNFIIKI